MSSFPSIRLSLRTLILSFVALVPALGTELYDHGDPSELEQVLLERINETRANPAPVGERLGVSLSDTSARQPLVFQTELLNAATDHSDYIISSGTFSHQGSGNTNAQQRMTAAGYPFGGGYEGWAENLGLFELTGLSELETVHRIQDLLFQSDEHRGWQLEPAFREIGLGIVTGRSAVKGAKRDVMVITQKFALSGASPSTEDAGSFIQGVVYDDANGDGRYDLSEGVSGMTITPSQGGYHAVTSDSGGYALPLANYSGSLEVTFTSTGVHQVLAVTMTPNLNSKLDLRLQDVPQTTIETPDHEFTPTSGEFTPLRIVRVDAEQVSFAVSEDPSSILTLQHSSDLEAWENVAAPLGETFQTAKQGRSGFYRFVAKP